MSKENGTSLDLDRIMQGFDSLEDLPGYLRIALIDACNHSCFFCHNEGAEVEGKKIDEDLMFDVINAYFSLGKNKIRLTGGEPTLHPAIVDYVKRIRDMNPNVDLGITTNGTRLLDFNKDFYEDLDGLTVSLHSLDHEVHKQITDRANLPVILQGLEYIKSLQSTNVKINATISQYNVQEIESLAEYARTSGFSLKFLDLLPSLEGQDPNILTHSEVSSAVRDIREERPDLTEQLVVKGKPFYEKCGPCDKKKYCGESQYLRLTASGELHPCLYRPDLVIGVSQGEQLEELKTKVALGLRRTEYSDM